MWSSEAAGSNGDSQTAVLLSSEVWGETLDTICKVRTIWTASLALWEPWTKPHPLDLTSWDEQLFDDHCDYQWSSWSQWSSWLHSLWQTLQKIQHRPGLARRSPMGWASEALRQHHFCRRQHPISNLNYSSKHLTQKLVGKPTRSAQRKATVWGFNYKWDIHAK